ncbi:unnamed protein product [Amoebophrya sp. A120]|nr:unnamed protein product [Amoebophrya sp. A120]|eukprot:GSA120T00014045001.1
MEELARQLLQANGEPRSGEVVAKSKTECRVRLRGVRRILSGRSRAVQTRGAGGGRAGRGSLCLWCGDWLRLELYEQREVAVQQRSCCTRTISRPARGHRPRDRQQSCVLQGEDRCRWNIKGGGRPKPPVLAVRYDKECRSCKSQKPKAISQSQNSDPGSYESRQELLAFLPTALFQRPGFPL